MLVFEYVVTLKEAYKPCTYDFEEGTEIEFTIKAKNRATADRMVKAMLTGCTNIEEVSGICVGREDEEND